MLDWPTFQQRVTSYGGAATHFDQTPWALQHGFSLQGLCVPLVCKWLQCQVEGTDFATVVSSPAGVADVRTLYGNYYGSAHAGGWDNPYLDTMLKSYGLVLEHFAGVSGTDEFMRDFVVDDRYCVIMFGNPMNSQPYQGHIFGLSMVQAGGFIDPSIGLAAQLDGAWVRELVKRWLPEYRSRITNFEAGNVGIRCYRHDAAAANRPPSPPIQLQWQ